MDFQPPQWGSAHRAPHRAHRTAHRRRAARSLKIHNLLPHCTFRMSPLARCHPDLQSCQLSHTTRTAPCTVGAPPGALKSIISFDSARSASNA